MTFCKYCKAIKQELGIKDLTAEQASDLMQMYLTRASVEDAVIKLKEKIK